MELRLFDTYERKLRVFSPLDERKVKIYACGPTVYDHAHIGNLRTYLFEDLLKRTLIWNGYDVEHVINITDVGHLVSDGDEGEDKMEIGSKKSGMNAWELADFYTKTFKQDLERLNILSPDIWCKATDHIPEQIAFIEDLEKKDFTYRLEDGIYFDSRKLKSYGYLARLDIEGLKEGARVEAGDRRFLTDFALWKFSPEHSTRQMEWDSPWGKGFPGWHIECSAMSAKFLGDFFDIHCGGEDHIPVHHTNEIAQTEASRGTRLANFWMHGYFLRLDEAKMSKSSGTFLTLDALEDKGFDPLVYRYFCLGGHYRTQISFTQDGLQAAQTSLNRLYELAFGWGEPGKIHGPTLDSIRSDLNDDLAMPKALATIWRMVKSNLEPSAKKATLLEFDKVLGLNIDQWRPQKLDVPDKVRDLVKRRTQARRAKHWAEADAIRQEISALGYNIKDEGDETTILPQ
ncbi:MAG: cysteine--tRNA ligase [Gammaproteobacteria bacterium]|nr:cysteine--tRNA ligase [Gammaproteobacteria bacterium]